jgi:osmotically-inducible protein OsmY
MLGKEFLMSHNHVRVLVSSIAVAGLLAAGSPALVAQAPADNTKVNTRDRAPGAVTADQQKNNAADLDVTKRIRQSLMADKGLSSYAHNVKVVTQGGHVTLKGPVRTEQEKASVEAKAVEVAGAGHVMNQLSIAPAKPAKK